MRSPWVFALVALLCSAYHVDAMCVPKAKKPASSSALLRKLAEEVRRKEASPAGELRMPKPSEEKSFSDAYAIDDILHQPDAEKTNDMRSRTRIVQRPERASSSSRDRSDIGRSSSNGNRIVQKTKWSVDKRGKRFENPRGANKEYASSSHAIGDKVSIVITQFSKLGASVDIYEGDMQISSGLILAHDLDFYAKSKKVDVEIGDKLDAYIQYIRSDGKMDISLRPVGFDRVMEAQMMVVGALEGADDNTMPIGRRTESSVISDTFPGMSKNVFKMAIGKLLREGVVLHTEDSTTLVPEDKRVPMNSEPYSGKVPQGYKPAIGCTLYVGNLPYETGEFQLAKEIEAILGFGKLAKLTLAVDSATEKMIGYAYASFFTPEMASEAMAELQGTVLGDRKISVDLSLKSPASLRDQPKRRTDSAYPKRYDDTEKGDMSANKFRKSYMGSIDDDDFGEHDSDADRYSDRADKPQFGYDSSRVQWSVYVGGLAYEASEEQVKYAVESSLRRGKGLVTNVRIMRNKDTNRSRGFGFIDFVDQSTAQRAVEELDGMAVMGRPIRLDLEGPKKGMQSAR